MSVLHIETTTQFEEKILQNNEVSIVDFYADWCMPCKMQAPILDQLAQERSDVVIAKVNVDDLTDIAQRYGIQTIPTIMVFQGETMKQQVAGVQTKDGLEQMIDNAK